MDPTRFTGRVALVTGAAIDIGRATALRLAREGSSAACVDLDSAVAVRKEIEFRGGRASSDDERGARARCLAAYEYFMPIRRLSSPDEQAAAIALFASDDASYINGVSLDTNGGLFIV